ncbi:16865_t:CDS:2 [Racocetra persica]|uniref:16865_t:CDS:1 n=1 Tax=Racocetra persica TaxID=160502 RepID=A0ACA9NCW0_9GLOM|nr:16865_t:CDS:2 [Racocetra persica]
MATRVDSRGHDHFVTDKSFHNLTRVASKKFSTLRHRISSHNSYFVEQRTYDDLELPRMGKENLSRGNDENENETITQELYSQEPYSQVATVLSNQENEQISTEKQPLKRNTSLVKVKNAVKRLASINKHERKRDSEAYHQDGKTNPFE